jgi:ketosteroid isomerase-like protein
MIVLLVTSALSPILAQSKSSRSTKQLPHDKTIEGTLVKMENDWEGVSLTKDTSTLDRILASDYVGTSPTGKVRNKEEQIAEAKRDTDQYTSATNSDMKVHIYGPDIAVVTGGYTEIGSDQHGKPFTRYSRWTDTYVKRKGLWQCVASQVTSTSKVR